MTAIEAIAQAWASIDGELDAFVRERDSVPPMDDDAPGYTGYYEGYTADAGELARRLRELGFVIVPVEPDEATLQRMAGAIAEGKGGYDKSDTWENWSEEARAAYRALVRPDEGERT